MNETPGDQTGVTNDEPAGVLKGYDAFTVTLGDRMRGERATMGKSLLDVQRDIRISADYLDAIESADATRFEAPAFVVGYVRSYAKYLGMDVDSALEQFCAESGFQAVSSQHALKTEKKTDRARGDFSLPVNLNSAKTFQKPINRDISFKSPLTPKVEAEHFFARLDVAALGSLAVLLALVSLIGYGGYALVREMQTVQIVPVEEVPVVVTDLSIGRLDQAPPSVSSNDTVQRASLDRLYQPQALEVPVVVPRDAPISMLDPAEVGVFIAPQVNTLPSLQTAGLGATGDVSSLETGPYSKETLLIPPQVTEAVPENVKVIAMEAAWVRVRSSEGNKLFEKTLTKGEVYDVPLLGTPPTLRAGMSGFVYVQTQNGFFGPLGKGTSVAKGVVLDQAAIEAEYPQVDADVGTKVFQDLVELVASAQIEE